MPDAAAPVVAYPGCPSEHGLAAATTTQLSRADIGAQVALMFVAGDPRQPLLIGRIQRLPQEALRNWTASAWSSVPNARSSCVVARPASP